MSNTARALRQLIREEIEDMMKEYRPNTFMLSRMEEKGKVDQDGDGDNDFDDVKIARRIASGQPKDKAIASVKGKGSGSSKKQHGKG